MAGSLGHGAGVGPRVAADDRNLDQIVDDYLADFT